MNIMHLTCFTAYKLPPVPFPPLLHFPSLTFDCRAKTRLQNYRSTESSLKPTTPSCSFQFSVRAATSDQGTESVVHFEDFVEKDWSFLDDDDSDAHTQKISRIISAGNIKETSKVLVSIGTEAFVDRLVNSSPCGQLLVAHDSLFTLACIKEKHDKVKCWQGELINIPERWAPLDTVYLYFLPALPFELCQVLAALSKNCSTGARIVISHTKGRHVVEEQQQQHRDVVVSSLPDQVTLERSAAEHAFQVVEFVDDPGFYLAVLQLS